MNVKKNTTTTQKVQSDLDRYTTNGVKVETAQTDPLSRYYSNVGELDKSYQAQQKVLDQSKQTAKEGAAVSYDVLKKYLPIQNKLNGMQGLGVSESAAIDAYNNYVSNVGAIEHGYASDSAALLENYRQSKIAEQKEMDAAIENNQNTAYQEAMTMIESGTYTDIEDLEHYLSTIEGHVSDEQWNNLQHLVNYYKNSPEEIEAREAAEREKAMTTPILARSSDDIKGNLEGMNLGKDGKNFNIALGKERLQLESKGVVDDETIKQNAQNIPNGQFFAMGNKIYYKSNGIIYEINGRGGRNTTKDYTKLYQYFYPEQ